MFAIDATDEPCEPDEPFVALPLLSDAFARLMALSQEDRLNLRLLELIVARDPEAVARLVALAATPALSGMRKIRSLNDALQALGANRACDALMAIWATAVLPADEDGKRAAGYLVHHVFSLCATMRKLARLSRLAPLGDSADILLLPLIDRLTLSVLLNEAPEHQGRKALMAVVHGRMPLLRTHPALQPSFGLGPHLARAWQMPDTVIEAVTALNSPQDAEPPLFAGLLALADAVCAGVPQDQLPASVLLDELRAKNIDATKLACVV